MVPDACDGELHDAVTVHVTIIWISGRSDAVCSTIALVLEPALRRCVLFADVAEAVPGPGPLDDISLRCHGTLCGWRRLVLGVRSSKPKRYGRAS